MIGSGASFSTVLSSGNHTITATVTDSDGASGSDAVSLSVGSQSGGDILLTTYGYVRGKTCKVDLEWSGSSATSVDIYRNGQFLTTVSNSGSYSDNLGKDITGDFTYQVCDPATCSNTSTATF